MGGQQSKSDTEFPEGNKSDSESEIKIILERVQRNVNQTLKDELSRAEDSIDKLFIKNESSIKRTNSNPEIVSISMSSTETVKPSKSSKPSNTKPLPKDSDLSPTSSDNTEQRRQMRNINTVSSDETSSSESNLRSKSAQMGGLTESEINIQVVPLGMNGGSNKFDAQFSESSPFITSEVFKKTLEQNGGAESEFDSNKLLNIIMQMGGEDSEEKSTESDKSEDEDDSESDLFDSEDEDDEEDKDENSEDIFDKSESQQVARSKPKLNRQSTPRDKDSSSSSSDSSSSSSASSSSSNSSSSSSSESELLVTDSSVGLAVPRRVAGLSGLNSSDSESSVYIMSSDSSIGSRDINLLSFDEPAAWGKSSKKSKKSKKY